MPKPQLLTVVDQQIRAHRLLQRRHQRRRLALQHRGQQTSREPVRQHRSYPHHLAGTGGEAVESLLHTGAQPSRQPVSGGHRTPAAHIEPALLAQTPHQLPDQERISVRLGGQIQQRRIGVSPHRVADHLGDRARRHRRHPHNRGTRAVQHRQGLLHRRTAGPAAGGQNPQHRHTRARGGQRPQRQQRAVIGPVDVLQHNRQRGRGGRRINCVGQIVHHPIPQIGRATRPAQRVGVANRRIGAQGGHEQREKRHRLLILECLTEQGAHPGLVGQRHHLGQQPALADARRALDDQHAPMPLHQRRHQRADHVQLARPAPNRRSHELAADVKKAG